MSADIRTRRSIEHIRRRVASLFVTGLSNVSAENIEKIRNSILKLELQPEIVENSDMSVSNVSTSNIDDEQTGRLKDVLANLDQFIGTQNGHLRFKLATKMVLALDQISLRQINTSQLSEDCKHCLAGNDIIYLSEKLLPENHADIERMIIGGLGIVELVHYVRSEFDPESVQMSLLILLLSHSTLRKEVLKKFKPLSSDKQILLGKKLYAMRNRLVAESGFQLLLQANSEEARIVLVTFSHNAFVTNLLRKEIRNSPSSYSKHLYHHIGLLCNFLPDSDEKLILPSTEEELARIATLASLLYLVKPSPDDVSLLKLLEKTSHPVIRSYAAIALLAAGDSDERKLKHNILDLEDHVLRIYSKLHLFKKGIIDNKFLLTEFNGDNPEIHKLTFEALDNLGDKQLLDIINPLVEETLYDSSPSARKKGLIKLVKSNSQALAWKVLLPASEDSDTVIASMAKKRLIELLGFEALNVFFDVSNAIFSTTDKLALEVRHYIDYFILPHIANAGDCRFTPYLNHLFVEHSAKKQKFDYDNTIKPILLNFGEPLIPFLGENLFASEQDISLAAEELLIEIGGEEAEKARAAFSKGAPPVETAFRQLTNPRIANNARQVIISEGVSTVPRLLALISDPRYREEVLIILAEFATPESFPAMLKLLGNPSADMLVSGDISIIMRDTGFSDRSITRHLITIGEPVVTCLVEKLQSDNWSIRYHATLILGEIGDSRAIPELIRLFHREDESLEVVGAIIRSFGLMETTEAVSIIAPHLADESRAIRLETYITLGRIGTKSALDALKESLSKCRDINEKKAIQKAINEAEMRG